MAYFLHLQVFGGDWPNCPKRAKTIPKRSRLV